MEEQWKIYVGVTLLLSNVSECLYIKIIIICYWSSQFKLLLLLYVFKANTKYIEKHFLNGVVFSCLRDRNVIGKIR